MPHRIGHGYDIHRLLPGGTLVVGGVTVSNEMHADAHSDGDVAVHALVDALLGAIGAPDIGELFSNTDPRWKNADSTVFLREAMLRVTAEQYRVVNADVTVQAERPKLKPFKPQMKELLSGLLHAPVNVKAGTNESCDAIGRGEAIAAHAVVLLAKQE
jgi:2-C-methyl-D-erythritol 2,4-cyclodiphosphate synthase